MSHYNSSNYGEKERERETQKLASQSSLYFQESKIVWMYVQLYAYLEICFGQVIESI